MINEVRAERGSPSTYPTDFCYVRAERGPTASPDQPESDRVGSRRGIQAQPATA